MSPRDSRRPGYIEHHRRNDSEDRYWRDRRRVTVFLIVWALMWAAILAGVWILL